MITWSTAATVTAAARKAFDAGHVLRELYTPVEQWRTFPLRVRIIGPDRDELVTRLGAARTWTRGLDSAATAGSWRLETKTLAPRGIGRQTIPAAAFFDSPADALAACTAGQQRSAQQFGQLLRGIETSAVHAGVPDAVVARAARTLALARPFDALDAAADWPLLLAVAAWLRAHPRPGVAVRQVPVAGMHTKVIETRRTLLSRLLDATLPAEMIKPDAAGFADRYGFRTPGRRVRLRGSGATLGLRSLLPIDPGLAHDVTVTWPVAALAALDPQQAGVREVVICENELSFATVPLPPGRLVVWGAGSGVGDLLSTAGWLADVPARYWGDIDTHGFALLDQLRQRVTHVRSVLMDEPTLLAHRAHWVRETTPVLRDLPHLTAAEADLYHRLRADHHGPQVRLEQELIGFDVVATQLR